MYSQQMVSLALHRALANEIRVLECEFVSDEWSIRQIVGKSECAGRKKQWKFNTFGTFCSVIEAVAKEITAAHSYKSEYDDFSALTLLDK